MTNPKFNYVTYIKSTPEKVWQALTTPEFTRQYWGCENTSDWETGSKWSSAMNSDPNTPKICGEVLESNPPRRLVLTWAGTENLTDVSCVTFEIELLEEMVRLTVVHDDFKTGSTMSGRISQGWPRVLSNLKTLLETGAAFNVWVGKEDCCGNK